MHRDIIHIPTMKDPYGLSVDLDRLFADGYEID